MMVLRSSAAKAIIISHLTLNHKLYTLSLIFAFFLLTSPSNIKRKGMVKWVPKGSQNKSDSLSSITRQALMPRYTNLSSPRCTSLKKSAKKKKIQIHLIATQEWTSDFDLLNYGRWERKNSFQSENPFLLEKHPGIQEVNTLYVQLLYTRNTQHTDTLCRFFSWEKNVHFLPWTERGKKKKKKTQALLTTFCSTSGGSLAVIWIHSIQIYSSLINFLFLAASSLVSVIPLAKRREG